MLVHLAKIFDFIADNLPDREAFIWRDRVLTYRDLQTRGHRAANGILAWGFGSHTERAKLQPSESGQDHVALYMYNCNEYLEAGYGAYFARAVPININYRYVADELLYVLRNSSSRAIVYHSSLAPRLREIRDQLPQLEHLVQVKDDSNEPLLEGAVEYESWLAKQSATLPSLPYSPDDLYILYTGGTTGLPKGVVWRHEDVYYNGLGGALPGFPRIETEEMLRDHINAGLGGRPVVCSPFMHGAGHWTSFNTFHRGGTLILPDEARRLDAHSVWEAVQRHKVDALGLIGDSFALPLLQALKEKKYDTSSIRILVSTAAVLSASVRKELLSYLPDGVMVIESVGASEAGLQAMSYDTQSKYVGIPAYDLREGTVLLNRDRTGRLDPATAKPGADGDIGWIATGGNLPLGYLGDPEKTSATFPMIGGKRYCINGDRACFSEEGRVLFLGRESSCINTGGEKVYVEEVERIVKSHPAIHDTLVVGLPNERWGQQVTAVITVVSGENPPTVPDLRAHCSAHLADYKIPRAIVVAPEIVRSPSGKPDYAWAKQFAAAATSTA
ncbi:MAG TPA: AMP-binding protein [Candidatus Acidoferrales bacterium]|nr:AMP-binding protein [Candidatus Acidoferrales bacterium]